MFMIYLYTRTHITISSDSLIPSMNIEVATIFLFYILCDKPPKNFQMYYQHIMAGP